MSSKVKVLHIVGKMNRGGLETFIMNNYRKIDRNKIQFDFVVTKAGIGHYDEEIISLGGNIYKLTPPSESLLKYISELKRLLKEKKYDVVHSHVLFSSGINLKIAKLCGVKKRIAHSHNTSDGKKNSIIRKIYRRYMRFLILRYSTNLLACGNEAGKFLYGDKKKFSIINNGIDFELFRENKYTKEQLREKFKLPRDKFIIGHIGRFNKQKNHMFLLEIFNYVLSKNDNAYLALIGDGDLKEKVIIRAKEMGIEEKVKFMGIQEEIPYLLKTFDVFLLPSLFEGLPVVLIEAQVSGVRCVVSDTVTKEANLTNNIKFIALQEDLQTWYENIVDTSNKNEKNEGIEEYNINNVVNKITEIYLN